MYLRIYSHTLLQIHLQNTREIYYSANKFAVTGANKFANTFTLITGRLQTINY
jgi:hypothetical protein